MPVLGSAQFCVLFYHVEYYRIVILPYVHDVRSLPFFRILGKLKLLFELMKIFKIIAILINRISNILIFECIADSRVFSDGLQSISLTREETSKAKNVIENLLARKLFYGF